MKVVKKPINHQDKRGIIQDILAGEKIDSIAMITCTKDAVRGNHHHKQSGHYTFVINGRLLYRTQKPNHPVEEVELTTGDLAIEEPLEGHALKALEDSIILHLYMGAEGLTYDEDTFPLETPLI